MAKPKLTINGNPVSLPAPAKMEQPKPMTGVAFSVEASNSSGHFPNYRICTLFVVEGRIVHIERSQEFAAFEAIARIEILVNSSLWNLSMRYSPGDFQSLGGDARDELVNRLKKSNPKLLELITPALCIPKTKDAE